jgi:2-dehydro-3-deoxygluconokinase
MQQPSKTTGRPHTIACLGECMLEIGGPFPAPLKLAFAGDTFNTAAYLARLLAEPGDRVEFLTAVGSDPLSRAMLDFMKRCNVGIGHIRRIENRRPGLYLIEISPGGERCFHYWRGESAAKFFLDEVTPKGFTETLCAFDGVYLSGISIAILTDSGRGVLLESLSAAKRRGLKIYFDSNYRPALWPQKAAARQAFATLLPLVDIAMITDTDMAQLYEVASDAVADLMAGFPIPEAVIKAGEKPCTIIAGETRLHVAAEHVEQVVDTTAAGDSFNAAYLAARLKGDAPVQAAQMGHRLAAEVIRHQGAIIDDNRMPRAVRGEPNRP